jgi:hypothetical protein
MMWNKLSSYIKRCSILSAGIMLSCAQTSKSANVAPVTNPETEPALPGTSASQEGLPTPFGSFDVLTEQEKRIIANALRSRVAGRVDVRILPTMFDLCVPGDATAIEAQLRSLFSHKEDVRVNDGCRLLSELLPVGSLALRADLVRGGSIDIDAIWSALINAFPDACGVDVDAASKKLSVDRRVRSFDAHDRRVASSDAFKGIVIKEKITMRIEAEPSEPVAPDSAITGVDLIVESTLFWRRASSPNWSVAATITHLDPAMLAGGEASMLGRCHRGLLAAVVR